MAVFSTQFTSFGLDISDGSLKAVQSKKVLHGTTINAWGNIKLAPDTIIKGDIQNTDKLAEKIKELTKNLRGQLSTNYVVSVLPEHKTFIKMLNIKNRGEKKENDYLTSQIDKELPKHVPIDVSELRYDFQIIKKTPDHYKVLVGAVPKKISLQYIEAIEKAGLKLLALEIEAQSISRAIFPIDSTFRKLTRKKTNSLDNPKIIVDLGANRSSIILWHKNSIQLTSSLELSGNIITESISQKLNINFKKAEKAKQIYGLDTKKGKNDIHKIISDNFSSLLDDIQKNIDYYKKNNGHDSSEFNILLTGGASSMSGLSEYLQKNTNMNVSLADPLTNININPGFIPKKNVTTMATAIGLSLRNFIIEDI